MYQPMSKSQNFINWYCLLDEVFKNKKKIKMVKDMSNQSKDEVYLLL